MATVIKKTTSKFWFAAFRDANGRQRRISTGTTDRERAKQIAKHYEMTTQKRGSPQKVREAFSNLFKEFFGEEVPSITVRKFVDRWLKDRKQETAPGTMAVYDNSVRRFLSFLGPDADRELADVTRTRITDYRNEMVDNLSTGTVNRELKIVKMIFRKARLDGFLFEDPAEAVSIIKRRNEENSRRPLTIPEIQAILAVADAEWQSIIKFGLYTGQRLADLALLTWNHVDLKRGEIQGVPDSVVMELVGHDSRAMTARYTSVGIEALAKAQGAMPKL